MAFWYMVLRYLVNKFPRNNGACLENCLTSNPRRHDLDAGNTICTYNFISMFKKTAIPAFHDKYNNENRHTA
jgi:hypothetical protein